MMSILQKIIVYFTFLHRSFFFILLNKFWCIISISVYNRLLDPFLDLHCILLDGYTQFISLIPFNGQLDTSHHLLLHTTLPWTALHHHHLYVYRYICKKSNSRVKYVKLQFGRGLLHYIHLLIWKDTHCAKYGHKRTKG